ncbi:hypothetical protein J4471_04530 [Candidatus Woesearchaeota archaeon]|nr:hypothetical protein [Candidatus Woesearchaeota archaeon]
MGIIEFHPGCANNPMCFGPSNYYTIFGVQTSFLKWSLLVTPYSLFLFAFVLLFYFALHILNKKTKFHTSILVRILITLALFVILWFLWSYFLQTTTVY